MNYSKKNLKSTGDSNKGTSVLLYAAALQDHYMRNNTLLKPLASSNIGLPTRTTKSIRIKTNHSKSIKPQSLIEKDPLAAAGILSGQYLDKNSDKPLLSIIEKQIKIQQKNEKLNNDMKLEKYNKKLTLAQKLGLFEKPPKPLTNDEWVEVEEKSKKRLDNEDCPICLEAFKSPNNQVILSCTHVFHKTCLSNFEKHTKMQQCPICRRKDYEKKNFDAGFLVYISKIIMKAQKIWRGYMARKRFYEHLITYYKPTTTFFKRRVIAYKLKILSNKMEEKMRKKRIISDNIINELDKNTLKNANLINQLTQIEVMRRENQNNFNELLPHIQNLTCSDPIKMKLTSQKDPKKLDVVEWEKIAQNAAKRTDVECAICFNKIDNNKKVYLLDCSHVFHCHCLNAFEYFDVYNVHNCPVCRHKYIKKEIDYNTSS